MYGMAKTGEQQRNTKNDKIRNITKEAAHSLLSCI